MSTPADRRKQRDYRRRLRAGKVILRIEVDELSFAAALVESGRLCDADTADRCKLERRGGEIIGQWIERWRG